MSKKPFNWVGLFLVSLYIFIFFFLFIISYFCYILGIDEGKFLAGIAVIWGFSWIRIIPITLNRTQFNLVSDKYVQAKLVEKGGHYTTKGLTVHKRAVLHTVLTFELSNGIRMVFEVKPTIFHTFLENDIGTLIYRQYAQKSFLSIFNVSHSLVLMLDWLNYDKIHISPD